jgi:hypothetical protein
LGPQFSLGERKGFSTGELDRSDFAGCDCLGSRGRHLDRCELLAEGGLNEFSIGNRENGPKSTGPVCRLKLAEIGEQSFAQRR